jgi:hypothetical protein
MVKLIRLTTTDENAIFDNDFVPNITIPPKSSIALKSLALENVISKININSRNDKLQFQVSNAQGALETQLTHAEYDNITAPSLFRDMNTQINKQYDPNIEGSNVGIETECFVNNENKVEIRTFRGQLSEHQGQLVLNKGAIPVQRLTPSGGYYRSNGTPTGNDCFMYDPRPIARGGGVLRFKIRRVNTTNANMIFGLTSINPDTITGTSFDLTNLDYAIKIPQIQAIPITPFEYGVGGTFVASSTIPSVVVNDSDNNDTLQFVINKGKIEGQVWKNGSGLSTIHDFGDYTYPTKLYPVVIFLNADIQIWKYRFSPSPFHNLDNSSSFDDKHPADGGLLGHGNEPPAPPTVNTSFNFIFEEQSLPTFLGYDNLSIPFPVGTVVSGRSFSAVAENVFKPNNKSDALIVEFLNLTLMSYDGLVKDRKSYLNVVPEDDSNGQILYDTPFPIYIDIDNASPLSIRNLRCRVLNNDLSSLVMRGLGTIVLLLKAPNED